MAKAKPREPQELSEGELSARWQRASQRYVTALNEFVYRGLTLGWENVPPESEPKDTRQPLAAAVLDAIRRANQSGNTDDLHERFPRAHGPFVEFLEANGQGIPVALLLDDGRIIARVGAPSVSGRVVVIDGTEIRRLRSDVITVGRSPGRECFAVAHKTGVTIHRGWDGPVTATLEWPNGQEGIPKGFEVASLVPPPTVTELIPFDSGGRALLVSPEGVFVLRPRGAVRLLPTRKEMRDHFKWLRKEYPGDPLGYGLSMEHGAISPDNTLIAAGHQSSAHCVFDASSYKLVAEVGGLSEYPHYAVFSADGGMIAFNSCHFYSGATVGVRTKLLPGLKTEPYELDRRLVQLQDGARVYAAVTRADEFIIGDANGYLRAFDRKGQFRWQHFIGSSVGAMDISPDGKRLVVTTYAGFLSILDLDTGRADPFAIGTATHREVRRWLFWKKEPHPLVW